MSSKVKFATKIYRSKKLNISAGGLMIACILSAAVLVCDAKGAFAMELSQYRWKNRLLFVFTPDNSNPHFMQLRNDINANKAEVEDRDLVIFEVLENDRSRMNAMPIDRQKASALRDYFAIAENSFVLILVGKDGGVKLRRDDGVHLKDIFELIDSMPMRRQEMRQKQP